MKPLLVAFALCLAVAAVPVQVQAQERMTLNRSDGAQIPVLDFLPAGAECPPLVIISHGFGGTETGHKNLARAAMQHGFRVLTIGHLESGRAALRSALRSGNKHAALFQAVTDSSANRARMRDLNAVWDYANADCRPSFTVLAGHSMGAGLTMMEAGAKNKVGVRGKDRFDAYVALSPQGLGSRFDAGAWTGVKKPVLLITGTRDRGLDGPWEHRLAAYEGLPAGHNKILAVLRGATHMDVGGLGRLRHQRNVRAIVLAFLKAMGKPSPEDMPHLAGVQYRTK